MVGGSSPFMLHDRGGMRTVYNFNTAVYEKHSAVLTVVYFLWYFITPTISHDML
jgi:hypothetical protein